MAGGKARTTEADQIAGAWEYLAEVELSCDVRTRMVLTPSHRTGVFHVRVEAFRNDPAGQPRRVCGYEHRWPNGQQSTLAGLVLGAAVKLAGMVEAHDRELGEGGAPTGTE